MHFVDGTNHLLYVNLYPSNFNKQAKKINNLFYDCRGLKYCIGWDPIANQQITSIGNVFNTCTNLVYTDFQIPENLYYDINTSEITLNRYILSKS